MQHKGWAILFGVVLFASFALWAVSPFVGWALPENVSASGPDVDYLYFVILGITAFFFVLTEALMVWSMYRFAGRPNNKAQYIEGHHRLETMWTIVPAGILLFIAIAQINTWEKIKYQAKMPQQPHLIMQVTARQWDWTMRYADTPVPTSPRVWAEIPSYDDVYVPDELHCWKDADVRIYLKTQDVLHSLFLPQMRQKQDALPGKTIPVWFKPTAANAHFDAKAGKTVIDADKIWEITCAELCGGGHYRMRGMVYVHESREDYLNWLTHAKNEARRRQPVSKTTPVAANN